MSNLKNSRIVTALICIPLCALGVYWGICAITGSGFFADVTNHYFNYSSGPNFGEYVFLGGVLPAVMIAFAIASVCSLGLIIHEYAYWILAGLMGLGALGLDIYAIIAAATDDDMHWRWYMVLLIILAFLLFFAIEAAFLAPTVFPFFVFEHWFDPEENGVLVNTGITLLTHLVGYLALAAVIFVIRTIGYVYSYLMYDTEFGFLFIIGGIILAIIIPYGGYKIYHVIVIED